MHGDVKVDGNVKVDLIKDINVNTFNIKASLSKTIRNVKLKIEGLPLGRLVSLIDDHHDITEYGMILRYPEGWRSVTTPLLVFELKDKTYMFLRSNDTIVREKRFYLEKVNDTLTAELIFEELGTKMTNEVEVPSWEVGFSKDIESIYVKQTNQIVENYGLIKFEERDDVPNWLKDVSLVVSYHLQHWTGNIFNTYKDVLEGVKKICKHIDGKHVLVYLPGWEGRYYYKYGNYSPDDRLGGEQGLREMVDGIHALGARVMPMYGINLANRSLESFERWGVSSEFTLPSGGKFHNGSVDWDSSRHYDHNSNANLNPAAPLWQTHLVNQIVTLSKKFNFDAAFLDIAAVWVNDAQYDLHPGIVKLCKRLREHNKDFLVSGEGWYDGLSEAMPFFHSGHTEGKMHYHDVPFEDMFYTLC